MLTFTCFEKQGKKNKKFFWVPAIAPLISVVLSTFFVYITHAEKKGVQIVSTFSLTSNNLLVQYCNLIVPAEIVVVLVMSNHSSTAFLSSVQVNHIEKGINPSSVNQIYFSGEYLLKGLKIGVVAGMIALTVSQKNFLLPIFTNQEN